MHLKLKVTLFDIRVPHFFEFSKLVPSVYNCVHDRKYRFFIFFIFDNRKEKNF